MIISLAVILMVIAVSLAGCPSDPPVYWENRWDPYGFGNVLIFVNNSDEVMVYLGIDNCIDWIDFNQLTQPLLPGEITLIYGIPNQPDNCYDFYVESALGTLWSDGSLFLTGSIVEFILTNDNRSYPFNPEADSIQGRYISDDFYESGLILGSFIADLYEVTRDYEYIEN